MTEFRMIPQPLADILILFSIIAIVEFLLFIVLLAERNLREPWARHKRSRLWAKSRRRPWRLRKEATRVIGK